MTYSPPPLPDRRQRDDAREARNGNLRRRLLCLGLVVMAAGIRPNIGLAKVAGLDVNRGILAGKGMQTSDPDILAVGECAEVGGQIYGLVAPLYEMARVAASNLAGDDDAEFVHSDTPTKLKVTGIDLFSVGDFADGEDRQEIVLRDASAGVYKRVVLKDNRILMAKPKIDRTARIGVDYAEPVWAARKLRFVRS